MHVIYNLTNDHISQLHALYKKEWWTNDRSLDETARCVQGSQIVIGLINNKNTLIGFVRVITDFTFKALIFDLIVDKNYRDKGLSKRLISLVKCHTKLKNISHFELYCLPELVGYYKKLGFLESIDGIMLLRHVNR